MDQFQLLGPLALKLHNEFRTLYYLMLPLAFALSIAIAWFKSPQGSPEFVESLKRVFVSTFLLVAFPEITEAILIIANGISDKISDMSGLDAVLSMAAQKAKSYTLTPSSMLLAVNDMIVAILAFLSYVILYVARYIMVAIYHFSWIFLSLIAPLILVFHVFSTKMTLNLFKSMMEVASWKIVWAVLSAMLTALPFGNAYMADGNYLTVIVLNFVIAVSMIMTPMLVKSLVGSGLSAVTGTMTPIVSTAMIAGPVKVAGAAMAGRQMLSTTGSYMQMKSSQAVSKIKSFGSATQSVGRAFKPNPEKQSENHNSKPMHSNQPNRNTNPIPTDRNKK